MDNEKDSPNGIAKGTENITARTPLKTQTKIGINRRQDQNKPYSKASEPKSKSSSQQTTSPGEIPQKTDQEFDSMNKKIRISQQSYRQIIANNKKQEETIENLMEIIKQQTERIENLEKQQRKEESEMEVVEIRNREENENPNSSKLLTGQYQASQKEEDYGKKERKSDLTKINRAGPSKSNGSNEISKKKGSRDETEKGKNTPPSGKAKPPPIVIFGKKQEETVSSVNDSLGKNNFYIKRGNANKHILYTNNVNDFNEAKKTLEAKDVKYFSYTPKENKIQSFLLKGLDINVGTNELLNELTEHNIDNITFTKVSRFTTAESQKANNALPIYLIQLSPDSQSSNLHKIKFVNYQVVRWEKLRKKRIFNVKIAKD